MQNFHSNEVDRRSLSFFCCIFQISRKTICKIRKLSYTNFYKNSVAWSGWSMTLIIFQYFYKNYYSYYWNFWLLVNNKTSIKFIILKKSMKFQKIFLVIFKLFPVSKNVSGHSNSPLVFLKDFLINGLRKILFMKYVKYIFYKFLFFSCWTFF